MYCIHALSVVSGGLCCGSVKCYAGLFTFSAKSGGTKNSRPFLTPSLLHFTYFTYFTEPASFFSLPLSPLSPHLFLTIEVHNGSVHPPGHCSGAVHGKYSCIYPNMRLHSLTTTVEVQEDRLALVHIPRHLGDFFLKPILQVLYHEASPLDENGNEVQDEDGESAELERQPSFLNLSITPVECSVMCPRSLAEKFFAPLVKLVDNEASITKDDFIAMQVYGEGLEAGQRVLELTSPLAMAGM